MVPDAGDKNTTGGLRGTRHRLRGPSRIEPIAAPNPIAPTIPAAGGAPPLKPAVPKTVLAKKRVLFVCIGNSCRSQMAEAFAKAYGADVIEVQSAGLSPAVSIAPLTKQTLAERNLNIDGHFPKSMDFMRGQTFDVLINMSGFPASLAGARVIEWPVPDPIGQKDSYYRTVATQIEALVMRLIMELRTELRTSA